MPDNVRGNDVKHARIITKGPKGSNLWFMDTDICFNGDKVSFVKTIINTGE